MHVDRHLMLESHRDRLIAPTADDDHKIEATVNRCTVTWLRQWISTWQTTFDKGRQLAQEEIIRNSHRMTQFIARVAHERPLQAMPRQAPHQPILTRRQAIDLAQRTSHPVDSFFPAINHAPDPSQDPLQTLPQESQ